MMKRNKVILLIFLTVCICACTSADKLYTVNNSFYSLPLNKKFFPLKYADTSYEYKGYYVLNTNDTLFYNVFYYVSPLTERCPEWPAPTLIYDTVVNGYDTTIVTQSVGSYANDDIDINRRQNIYYRFSDELKVDYKITVPIDSSRGGFFGIYVDSLHVSGNNVLQMNVFIDSPSLGAYTELYQSFFNLKFIPFDDKKFKLPEARIH